MIIIEIDWKLTSTPVFSQGKIFEWCSNVLKKTTVRLRTSSLSNSKMPTSLLIAPADSTIINSSICNQTGKEND